MMANPAYPDVASDTLAGSIDTRAALIMSTMNPAVIKPAWASADIVLPA